MSVTFSIQKDENLFQVVCSCGETTLSEVFDSYMKAAALHPVQSTCADEFCRAYPARVELIEDPAFVLNISNVNAASIFEILGFDENTMDWAGSISGAEMLGRVLMAEAVLPADAGVPAFAQGNMMFGGRPEGYLQHRLSDLRSIAEEAQKTNALIVWS